MKNDQLPIDLLVPVPIRPQISPEVPAAALLPAVQMYIPSASYQISIDEIAPCDETDFLACDRKPPQSPTPVAVVPTISPSPDSNDFERRESVVQSRAPLLPIP